MTARARIGFAEIVGSERGVWQVQTAAAGPPGRLPLTAEMLLERPSGDIFGWTQNAGMGWDPRKLRGKEFLILSTQGGIRAPDGTPDHTRERQINLSRFAGQQRLTNKQKEIYLKSFQKLRRRGIFCSVAGFSGLTAAPQSLMGFDAGPRGWQKSPKLGYPVILVLGF